MPAVTISVNGVDKATTDAEGIYSLLYSSDSAFNISARKENYQFNSLDVSLDLLYEQSEA